MEAAHVTIHLRSIDAERTWFPALQIPHTDIQRFSFPTPLKWFRFVAFTVCGAHGDLSHTPDGPVVDYEITDIGDTYYYNSTEEFHLIDYKAVKDQLSSSGSSSVGTPPYSDFRHDVIMRDGSCVITGYDTRVCDAAHIIPRWKGDEYITFVVNDRRKLYQDQQFPPEAAKEVSIDIVENGLLLTKDLRACLQLGMIAFLKTPNFAMQCKDVPRVEEGPMPDTRITLQYMEHPRGYWPSPQCDVIMTGTGESPPPGLLLDFMYGVAAYKFWHTTELLRVLEKRSKDYEGIPPLPRKESRPSDDTKDIPKRSRPKHGREEMSMLEAMDHVLLLSMLMKGRTPEKIAAEQERQEKEAEARAQEAGRAKVKEWQKMQEGGPS